jgi:hypothetical protein
MKMDEDLKNWLVFWRYILITVLTVVLMITMVDYWHTWAMAKQGLCYNVIQPTNTGIQHAWEKCK